MSEIIYQHPFLKYILLFLATDAGGVIQMKDVTSKIVFMSHIWGGCTDRYCMYNTLPDEIVEQSLWWLLCSKETFALECQVLYRLGLFFLRYDRAPYSTEHKATEVIRYTLN